jgi:hypothetical protein
VPPDLLDGDPPQGVDHEYAGDEVDCPRCEGDLDREGIGPPLDGVVQGGDAGVVEGEAAADEGVEDNAAAPDVGLGARVGVAGWGGKKQRSVRRCGRKERDADGDGA